MWKPRADQVASVAAMEAYSRDLMRGINGGDDGEHKETVDLTLNADFVNLCIRASLS